MNRLFQIAPAVAAAAWVVLAKLTGFEASTARTAALALAAAALASVILLEARSEASPIHKGLAAYAAAGTAFVWVRPPAAGAWIGTYPATVLYAVLLLVAVAPPLLGKEPFTMYFARKTTPQSLWGTDLFLSINRRLTAMWALLFAAAMASSALPGLLALRGPAWQALFEGLVPAGLLLLLGIPANRRYPAYRQKKLGLSPAGSAGEKTKLAKTAARKEKQ